MSSAFFPNDDAIVRLVGAILMEQNDEWAVQRARYMTLETIAPISDSPSSSCRPWPHVLARSKRNKHAALELMRKLLKKYAFAPERLVTDDLRSYVRRPAISASSACMSAAGEETMRQKSHQPTRRRERKMQRFRERRLRAEIPLNPLRRVQPQRPTPSHVSSITACSAPRR